MKPTTGSLEADKLADLFVIDGRVGDPYAQLLEAGDADVGLVMIGGVARSAAPAIMSQLAPARDDTRRRPPTRC